MIQWIQIHIWTVEQECKVKRRIHMCMYVSTYTKNIQAFLLHYHETSNITNLFFHFLYRPYLSGIWDCTQVSCITKRAFPQCACSTTHHVWVPSHSPGPVRQNGQMCQPPPLDWFPPCRYPDCASGSPHQWCEELVLLQPFILIWSIILIAERHWPWSASLVWKGRLWLSPGRQCNHRQWH